MADINGDGLLDIYVCNSGDIKGDDKRNELYINNGKGIFSASSGLPNFSQNKSVVRAADFDGDGDLDLFVGGRTNQKFYGDIPASYLLRNDGKGNFEIVTKQVAPGLENVGMVTDACWADVNNDHLPDLIVAGEWMPVTIYLNHNGRLEKQNSKLNELTGS